MPIKGIDTSKHQASKVDYAKAKAYGYDFACLRIGCSKTKDVCFEVDYKKAKDAGLHIGVYYAVNSKNPAMTKTEAITAAENVKTWLGTKELNMPVVFDIEGSAYNVSSRKDANVDLYYAFADKIKSAGYSTMLYTGESLYNYAFNKNTMKDPLWIAKYGNTAPNVGRGISIWQYTSNAIDSDFYKEKLDRNYLQTSYDELMGKTESGIIVPTSQYSKTQFIKDVQKAIGAKVDGIAGAETLSKTVTVSKKVNNKHAVVKPIQKYLNSIGYNCGEADCIAGAKFDAALKLYQKANGCVADGEATAKAKTWKMLLGIK